MSRTRTPDEEIYGDFLLNSSPFAILSNEEISIESDPELDSLLVNLFGGNDQDLDMVDHTVKLEDVDLDDATKNEIDEFDEETGQFLESKPLKVENGRFKKLTEDDMKEIEKHGQSESTKKNTKWGMNLFEEWCIESGKPKLEMETATPDDLANYLRAFYAEATPKQTESRKKSLPDNLATEYHRNTLKNILAAINRRLKDLGRDIDSVRDKPFVSANKLLNAKLKLMVKSGSSRPTQHKKIIECGDLEKINDYLSIPDNAEILMYRVWYNLAIHFVSRGLEFHHQLTLNSFDFEFDDSGREFVTLSHETQQKNTQGGLSDSEASSDKRMYATNNESCPVQSLKLFLSHVNPMATALFCRPKKPVVEDIWYTLKPISKRMFSDFMQCISNNAGCSNVYTAHSLRATAIQMLSDAGIELRHIMLMSGHRNESSVRSYSRDCSSDQKRFMSDTLARQTSTSVIPVDTIPNPDRSIAQSISENVFHSSSSLTASHGILAHSNFENCQFTFHMNQS